MQLAVKGMGLLLILAGCVLFGAVWEERLKHQWRLLTEWKEILCCLEKEMTWHRMTLSEALSSAAKGKENSLEILMNNAAEELQKREGRAFETVWQEAVRKAVPEEELSCEKRKLLEEAASALCAQDIVMQKTLFEKCIWHLEEAAKDAEREYMEKGRLYRRLSMAAGVFVVILLL